ncbi:hypothetical protein [Luteimonas sp. R10]|uniref:hypothetical protein n=1 Tax=Luteimonas sp. R10 TaxID=3108176 RepID=UPI0030933931|nr:hypothetical protein U3649_00835 [Luteimonas sp. R10]
MSLRRQPKLAAAALGIALALVLAWVLAVPVLSGRWLDRPTPLEPALLPVLSLVCGGPVLALAALMVAARLEYRRALRALFAGALATSAFWALYHGWVAWWAAASTAGDADIGIGLLMLASPLLVAAAMTLAYQFPGLPPDPDSR